jgi:hypothetical protein
VINGKPYKAYQYEKILKEQLLIAYLSKGAITISETDTMPINDRKILLTTLRQAEEDRRKKIEEIKNTRMIKAMNSKRKK